MTASAQGAGPLPFLEFNGVELGNAARTLSYLRRGLGNTNSGHWEIGNGDVCSVLYRPDVGGASGCLKRTFLSPASDPAPWYDANEPGSSSFLGFVLLDIEGYDGQVTRAVTQRINALGGGIASGQHRKPREWKFRGALVSSDGWGAEYGLRWLKHVLENGNCDLCSGAAMGVRLTCPPDDCSNDNLGYWLNYNAILTDGPHEVAPWAPRRVAEDTDVLAGCRDYVIVEFTVTALNPFMYKPPTTVSAFTLTSAGVCTDICSFLFGATNGLCVTASPPKRGILGTIYTLTSTGGYGGIVLSGYRNCSSTPTGTPALQIMLSSIPPGSTVVVDSSQHTITLTDVNGKVSDGSSLVQLAAGQGIQWLEMADCDTPTCFCLASASPCDTGSLTATVQTQLREG